MNNAVAGDTIYVYNGTYNENVNIGTPHLTLKGEGAGVVTVTAAEVKGPVFRVTAAYVNITGFHVTGATYDAGVCLYHADHCNISDNIASGNGHGIYLCWGSTGNTIERNNIIANGALQGDGSYRWQFYNDQSDEVSTAGNWWGTNSKAKINASIYDWTYDTGWGNVTTNPKLGGACPCTPAPELPTESCTCGDICVNTIGWWRNGRTFNASGTPIQSALDNAIAGDTIYVYNGTYNENVKVNKWLTLEGEGAGVVTVTAAATDDHVFNVTAAYVNITGFHVTGATYIDKTGGKAGIYLNNADHCNISDNTASNNYDGIDLYDSCDNNTLTGNNCSGNDHDGIELYDSSDNTVTENTANENSKYGIRLETSSNNNLTGNTVHSNTEQGIYLTSSSNNWIYNNHFDNTNNAWDDGTNVWNITKTSGTNIVSGSYLGGNYWSDYAGNDTGEGDEEDGLGDTELPYNCSGNITNGGDRHPLIPVDEPSPCYIATATYGTPLDRRIDVLRDFRDNALMTNPIGEAFVSTYYRTSPPIADALRANDGLRTVTRLTLITPLVYLSKFALNGILLVFILGLAAGILLIRERDRNGFLRSLLVGMGSILVFTAAIFLLGFIGYTIPVCAGVGAYLLPFVIPVSLGLAIGAVWKRGRKTTSSSLHFL